MTIAIVESPFQFLSALEAAPEGERVRFFMRPDLEGMKTFLGKLPLSYLEQVDLVWRFPSPAEVSHCEDTILLGDINSGRLQRLLVRAQLHGFSSHDIVIVDDGWSTLRAIRNLGDKRPLVRPRVESTAKRLALGFATQQVFARLLSQQRVTWVTALPVSDDQFEAFQATGGKVLRHSFSRLRAARLCPVTPHSRAIIGSSMVADGLVDTDAYLQWVREIAAAGEVSYYPHRRESQETLSAIEQIPGVTVTRTGLPVEIVLAQAPTGTQVHSLPSTTLATLPMVMDRPQIRPQVVPQSWWSPEVPSHVRAEFNRFAELAEEELTKPVLIAISDSESYLKWSAALCTRLAPHFDTHVWLVDNPILPTQEQISNALVGTAFEGQEIPVLNRFRLERSLAFLEPSLLLAAATGPVVQELYASAAKLKRRPGLISGLPGVGLPATTKGQRYRQLGDMFIAHSRYERDEYEFVIAKNGYGAEVVVNRLPMLESSEPPTPVAPAGQVPKKLIFAPQAKVPVERDDRKKIVEALGRFKRNFPDSQVIVKVRSRPGEQETHHENFPYPEIIRELVHDGRLRWDDIDVEVGAMSSFLTEDSALVTVSSTAALESLDRGLPTLIIDDFGVNDEMLNRVFADSEITGSLDDMATGRFTFPSTEWLAENYFQPRSEELTDSLRLLAKRSLQHQLPSLLLAARQQAYRSFRTQVRLVTPKPIVRLYRLAKYRR